MLVYNGRAFAPTHKSVATDTSKMERTLIVALLCVFLCGKGACGAAYVTLNGARLQNHALVDLSLIGDATNGANSLQCHTDLASCCTTGAAGGDWFAPDNQRVGNAGDVYAVLGEKRVDLRISDYGEVQSGIYRCEIDTVSGGSGAFERESVHVGVYASGRGM